MNYDREFLTGTVGVLILSLLGERAMYGYEIPREADRRSERQFQMKEGTLYPAPPSDGTRRLPEIGVARERERAGAEVLRPHRQGTPTRGIEAPPVGGHLGRDAHDPR
jgi:PadR family transcriptional regulator